MVGALGLLACSRDDAGDLGAGIDGMPIHAEVVDGIAARDGIDGGAARSRVIDTLRLVAAAAAERGVDDPALTEARRSHLRRTALARLLLHTEFEPTHRLEDIPPGDPLLQRARSEQRFVHPTVHHVCQIIAAPPGALEPAELERRTADPTWRALALARVADVRRHVEAIVMLDDDDACTRMFAKLALERGDGDDDDPVVLRSEGPGGFDLDACSVEPGPAGSCSAPRFAPEWVEAVRTGPTPGLRGPFASRFGVHLVLVREILPANLPDDEGFEARLRAAVHPTWRAAAAGAWIAALRTRHAALIASGAE